MANCTQCGAAAADTAQFCPSCGLRLPRPAQPPVEEVPAPPRWHRGRRVVVGFLIAVVVLATAFVITVVYLIRNTTVVTTTKGGSRVEAPFGVVTTTNDPGKLAKSLAIDVYPGAVGEKSAQADLVTNNMVSLQFHSNDAPRRVISFYHVRYPDATFKSLPGGGYSLVQLNGLDTLTIQATPEKGKTLITINDIKR
ncbi:MAG TPA: zinc ribbon domain-containing protein [Terriglobales bacterium]|nr:zinc ribbon domain-containing protein [Terriglobales bacterium]